MQISLWRAQKGHAAAIFLRGDSFVCDTLDFFARCLMTAVVSRRCVKEEVLFTEYFICNYREMGTHTYIHSKRFILSSVYTLTYQHDSNLKWFLSGHFMCFCVCYFFLLSFYDLILRMGIKHTSADFPAIVNLLQVWLTKSPGAHPQI